MIRQRTLTTATLLHCYAWPARHRERIKHTHIPYRRGVREPYYTRHFAKGRHARPTWLARAGL